MLYPPLFERLKRDDQEKREMSRIPCGEERRKGGPIGCGTQIDGLRCPLGPDLG